MQFIIGAWRQQRDILSIRPEDFGEMVRIIEEATHTSPSLEIVLGGWNSVVGQDWGLVEREIHKQLFLSLKVRERQERTLWYDADFIP
jgi:hypothetical protein